MTSRRAGRWLLVYAGVVLLALLLPLGRPLPPARTYWIEFGVALGFIGLAMLWLQFALTARFRNIAAPLGLDTLLQFHGQAGVCAIAFALAHPAVLIAAHPPFIEFLDPRVSAARALALLALIGALLLLALLTFRRRPLRIPYEWWRVTHGVLGFGVLFLGTVHVLRVGYYISTPWKQAAWVAFAIAATALLVHTRVIRPLRLRREPYRVTAVRAEAGDAWTLELLPEGHAGMTFAPGQFAWLTLGGSPFSLQQHPFSFSSSAHERRLAMTIKALGNFTATVGDTRPGTIAWLEGPYGAFTLDPAAPAGVFIAGGVGITPIMSILRTLRDSGDRRPLTLIYATSAPDRTLFINELDEMRHTLDLRVVHVFEQPPGAWRGDRGLLTREILHRHLPPAETDYRALICGPQPLMDLAEGTLEDAGIPSHRIRTERFSIVQ